MGARTVLRSASPVAGLRCNVYRPLDSSGVANGNTDGQLHVAAWRVADGSKVGSPWGQMATRRGVAMSRPGLAVARTGPSARCPRVVVGGRAGRGKASTSFLPDAECGIDDAISRDGPHSDAALPKKLPLVAPICPRPAHAASRTLLGLPSLKKLRDAATKWETSQRRPKLPWDFGRSPRKRLGCGSVEVGGWGRQRSADGPRKKWGHFATVWVRGGGSLERSAASWCFKQRFG